MNNEGRDCKTWASWLEQEGGKETQRKRKKCVSIGKGRFERNMFLHHSYIMV